MNARSATTARPRRAASEPRIIAIDWSGAKIAPERTIWIAGTDDDGRLHMLENGRDREQVLAWLIDQTVIAQRDNRGLVVGLDFAFSFPRWFMQEHGFANAPALWRAVASGLGERWLGDCPPPFFGRAGTSRPCGVSIHRRTELGLSAKSIFQIAGPGAVGTGSLRGMPILAALMDAGWSIWPFVKGPSPNVALEIYPRLFTGPIVKTNARARATLLKRFAGRCGRFERHAVDGDDAFDAAVSVLSMHDHAHFFRTLAWTNIPVVSLEGAIWRPERG